MLDSPPVALQGDRTFQEYGFRPALYGNGSRCSGTSAHHYNISFAYYLYLPLGLRYCFCSLNRVWEIHAVIIAMKSLSCTVPCLPPVQ